jgi:hypothetical protein
MADTIVCRGGSSRPTARVDVTQLRFSLHVQAHFIPAPAAPPDRQGSTRGEPAVSMLAISIFGFSLSGTMAVGLALVVIVAVGAVGWYLYSRGRK